MSIFFIFDSIVNIKLYFYEYQNIKMVLNEKTHSFFTFFWINLSLDHAFCEHQIGEQQELLDE
jgi:hypothetical protein